MNRKTSLHWNRGNLSEWETVPYAAADDRLTAAHIQKLQLKGALEQKQRRSIDVEVTNTDRSFGTIFGSEITKKYGGEGLPEDTFIVKCNGAGGQSFGAFIPKGTLKLVFVK